MGITASIDISAEQRRILLDLINKYLPNTAIWAFGSRVKWTTRSNSDLDLVAFSTPQQDQQISALKEAFEESSLPFRVDLLVWDKLPENFQRNIREGYVVLVEAKDIGRNLVNLYNYDPSEYVTIPVGWDCKRLSDCTLDGNISYGIVQPGFHDIHGVPVIRINNINNGQLDLSDVLKVSPEIEKKYERTRLNGGEVLLTLVGSTGQSFVAPKELIGWNVPRAIAVIRPNEEIGANWINICLQSRETKHFLDVRANTTVQKTLNLKDVRDIPILIPPPEVKELIEGVALSISDKIELNRQTNQTLEQIAQAIFKSWFVDFEPVKAKVVGLRSLSPREWGGVRGQQLAEQAAICAISGKTSEQLAQLDPQILQQLKTTAALFPDALVDSELGEMPVGWEVQTVEDIIELVYGKALNKTVRIDGEFPVYGSGGLTGKHNQSLVEGPGIIVGRKGTVGSLFWEDKPFYPIDTVFYVKSKNGMTLEFSYYLLQTLGLEDMNTDAAVPGLNRNNVYRLEVPKYPKVLVEEYSKIIGNIRNKIRFVNDEVVTLENIRASLLPKLLSGEITLPNQDEAA